VIVKHAEEAILLADEAVGTVPPVVSEAIVRTMAKNPHSRFRDYPELRLALAQLLPASAASGSANRRE
jgi:hypothetical protein